MIEEKRKSKGKTIAIIILVILLIGSLSYIAYDLYFYKYFKKEVKVVEKKKETKTELKEVELKDNTVKRQIENNLSILIERNNFYEGDYDKDYFGSGLIFNTKDKITINDINNSYMLYSVINHLVLDSRYEEIEENNKVVTKILKTDVDNKIKEVYGDNFELDNIKCEECCPGNIQLKNNYYEFENQCGGTGYSYTSPYTYKITTKNNFIYAYVAVAYNYFNDGLNSNGTTYLDSKIYKNLEKEEYSGNTDDFKINEDNYQEFSKYKITFEKTDEGDYIFKESVRIEK